MVHSDPSISHHLKSNRFKMYLLYSISLIAIGGFFVFRWYSYSYQEKAQRVYAEAADQFRTGLSGVQGAWLDLEFISQLGYEHYSSSLFGPYFLALKAEGQLQQKKYQEAISTLDQMMQQLSSDSPLFFVYATKNALIKLDSQDQKVREQGVKELASVAYNPKNIYRDEARYYLGLCQLIAGEREAAKTTWMSLVEEYSAYESEKASPWVGLAENKLIGL